MISQGDKEKILESTKIEEVVGEFVQLKKRGSNMLGLCPFHNEKTPSFLVSPVKGIYKCFGCGKAGNSVSFLMEHEHFSYPEALRFLARKYGVEIEEEPLSDFQRKDQSEREAMFQLTDFAYRYYQQILHEDERGRAIGGAYFREREIQEIIVKQFGLGYSLDEWDAFTHHALKNGYSLNLLEKTGFTIVKDGRTYDRFRGRVLFPVFSISGRVLGFSARILSSSKQAAKYVNSPESEIYVKSKTLYGLYQAKNEMIKQDLCYLVEGNIDVISLYQSGIPNTVASSGTSLTEDQIKLIRRFTRNIVVLYDGDKAGVKAAMRATDLLLSAGLHVKIVMFPEGEDPDSYARKHTQEELITYLKENADNFILYKTKLLAGEAEEDPIKRATLIHEVISTIALVPDQIERNEYLRICANLLKVSEENLSIELARKWRENSSKEEKGDFKQKDIHTQEAAVSGSSPSFQGTSEAEGDIEFLEKKIIEILLNYGANETSQLHRNDEGTLERGTFYVAAFIIGDLMHDELSFTHPLYQTIFDLYKQELLGGKIITEQYFIQHEDEEIRSIAVDLLAKLYDISQEWLTRWQIYIPMPYDQQIIDSEIRQTLLRFKLSVLEKKMKVLGERIKELDKKECSSEFDPIEFALIMNEKIKLTSIRSAITNELKQVIK